MKKLKRKLKKKLKRKKKPVINESYWDKMHPYPRWCGIVTSYEYVIGFFDGKQGIQCILHCTKMGNKTIEELNEICLKHLKEIVTKKGGSSIETVMVSEFAPHIKEQLMETKTYPVEVNGEEIHFETKSLQCAVSKIVLASRKHLRVKIRYLKKDGTLVLRNCACYSVKDNFIYVTDTRHGNKNIRSYDLGRIRGVKILSNKFKPEWDIKL